MPRPGPYEPEALDVIDREGRPLAVVYRKRRLLVAAIVDTWRIDEEWWREEVSRLYFLIELESRKRMVVFRDLIHGGWFRQDRV